MNEDLIYDDLEYEVVTEETMRLYPKMAKAGWCFSGNVEKIRVENECDRTGYGLRAIKRYDHMEADAAALGIKLGAFWNNGYKDIKMIPTFIKVNKKEFLDELGFEERSNVEVMGCIIINTSGDVSRFELMELVEE